MVHFNNKLESPSGFFHRQDRSAQRAQSKMIQSSHQAWRSQRTEYMYSEYTRTGICPQRAQFAENEPILSQQFLPDPNWQNKQIL